MLLALVVCTLVAIAVALPSMNPGEQGGEIIAELPTQPMVFNTPDELRNYLQELDKYFAIVGRPRFGRTVGNNGYARSMYPYFRTNAIPPTFGQYVPSGPPVGFRIYPRRKYTLKKRKIILKLLDAQFNPLFDVEVATDSMFGKTSNAFGIAAFIRTHRLFSIDVKVEFVFDDYKKQTIKT